jgi:hypothetical protein
MVAATKGGQKDITTVSGCEVVYLSTVATGYTYASRFGKIQAAFFQPINSTITGADFPFVRLSVSGSTITLTISGGITAGYLQIWGD